jgi:hypothetical protein
MNTSQKFEAINELKELAKSGSDEFWASNTAQIVSVLLESFHPCIQKEGIAGLPNSNTLTGITPVKLNSNHPSLSTSYEDKENSMNSRHDHSTSAAESMHLSCKLLLVIVKYRSVY